MDVSFEDCLHSREEGNVRRSQIENVGGLKKRCNAVPRQVVFHYEENVIWCIFIMQVLIGAKAWLNFPSIFSAKFIDLALFDRTLLHQPSSEPRVRGSLKPRKESTETPRWLTCWSWLPPPPNLPGACALRRTASSEKGLITYYTNPVFSACVKSRFSALDAACA